MSKSVVFDIENLYCKYKNKDFAALRIDSLEIKNLQANTEFYFDQF